MAVDTLYILLSCFWIIDYFLKDFVRCFLVFQLNFQFNCNWKFSVLYIQSLWIINRLKGSRYKQFNMLNCWNRIFRSKSSIIPKTFYLWLVKLTLKRKCLFNVGFYTIHGVHQWYYSIWCEIFQKTSLLLFRFP